MDGGIVIADELEFIDINVIEKAILPLFVKDNVCFIGITTPSGRDGFSSRITSARNECGVNPFNVVAIKKVCDSCVGTDMQNFCTHIYKPPHFQDAEKKNTISMLYSGGDETKNAELLCVTGSSLNFAFEKLHVEHIFNKEKIKMEDTNTKFIFVGVDTSGISVHSETSIVSIFYKKNEPVICGIDSKVCQDENLSNNLLIDHVWALMNKFGRKVKIIIIPEVYSKNASMMSKIFVGMDNVYIAFQKSNDYMHAGVITTNRTKELGVGMLKSFFIRDSICIHENFITSECKVNTNDSAHRFFNAERLKTQLLYFSEKITKSKNGVTKYFYSGKNSNDGKDDIVMALKIAVYWSTELILGKIKLSSVKNLNNHLDFKFLEKN